VDNRIHTKITRSTEKRQFHQRRRGRAQPSEVNSNDSLIHLIDVGRNLHDLRNDRRLSIRSLAELSGLNVNTLSLIENGKTSPSVSTLQQLASALAVPVTAFFETDEKKNNVSHQKLGQRLQAAFAYGTLADLGAGLTLRGGQPLLVTLEPKANSGSIPIVHTGHEFVFCLEGRLTYTIEGQTYTLDPGDSLLFEAHLPHRWQNVGETVSKSLLIMCPTDESDHPQDRHFKAE
jgi:transcriptional regulator with XRE-family HTH domain